MNIRRGLFRAWLGFSLIWACLVGVIFFDEGKKYIEPIRLTVAGTKFEFPGTASRNAVKETLVTFFEHEKINGSKSVPPTMDPKLDATDISEKFTNKDFPEFARQVSTLLVSVPAILFLLGALLLWIGAGFRRPPGTR